MKKWGNVFGIVILLVVFMFGWRGSVRGQSIPPGQALLVVTGSTTTGVLIPVDTSDPSKGYDFIDINSSGGQDAASVTNAAAAAGSTGLGQTYGGTNAAPNIGGLYLWPNNPPNNPPNYFEIQTGVPGAVRLAGARTCRHTTADCDDEGLIADWSSVETVCSKCVADPFNTIPPLTEYATVWNGDRIRYKGGNCGGCRPIPGGEVCGVIYERAKTCKPACPAGTTYTPVRSSLGCMNYDKCANKGGANITPNLCKGGSNWNCGVFVGKYTCNVNPGVVSGRVYFDPSGTCSRAQTWDQGAGLKVTMTDGSDSYESNVVGGGVDGGKYLLNATSKTYSSMTISGIPTGYSCSTCTGIVGRNKECPVKTNVVSPSTTDNDFFITRSSARLSWWQVEGAGVYAGGLEGSAIQSLLPDASTYLIKPGTGSTVGALLRGSGSVNTGAGTVSNPGYSTITKYKGKKMNYAFFGAKMGVLPSQAERWGITVEKSNCSAGEDFCYGPGASTGLWDVQSGEKYVVFVNGDLKIINNITVENGGFVAFIVKGDITVDPAVTSMQGIYIAGGDFVTEKDATSDVQLEVQGSVIAWGLVDLNRDLASGNALLPAEKFIYRKDLIENMPARMKTFAMEWQEVVSGTYRD